MAKKSISVPAKSKFSEADIIAIAREIAMDVRDPATILETYKVTPDDWKVIQKDKTYLKHVETFTAEWNTLNNTENRVKIKTAVLIESWLPEGNRLIWSGGDSLAVITELVKLFKSLAGQ